MTVVTRFAPSPTGFLHIGGARTALFNWLFARHHGGVFRLRIEDTDRQRSTEAAIDAILDSMKWLGLNWDDETVYQFSLAARHAAVAHQLLAAGKAYRCYCTVEELEKIRQDAMTAGKPLRYDGRWRDRDPKDAPKDIPPVIRLKAPTEGETIVEDLVQGAVRIANEQLDDMVLLRSDGTPTYMLSVVVDDHDMGISHVIRGDDHLTNTFRQIQIYHAMGWQTPAFAHIPMIHGPDGSKLSKRHGALGVEAYRDMGYLPEAICNYLLRLGWSHGDDEMISMEQATAWFNLDAVGRSPSRFDFSKLNNLNAHYLRQTPDEKLAVDIGARLGCSGNAAAMSRLVQGMPGLKSRAQTLKELAENAAFYVAQRPIPIDGKAQGLLTEEARKHLHNITTMLEPITTWTATAIEEAVRLHADSTGIKLGQIAQPLRAALTGAVTSPSIFEVMETLGKEECLGRISDVCHA